MLIVVSFFFTSGLPTKRFDELQAAPRPPPVGGLETAS